MLQGGDSVGAWTYRIPRVLTTVPLSFLYICRPYENQPWTNLNLSNRKGVFSPRYSQNQILGILQTMNLRAIHGLGIQSLSFILSELN